MQFIHPSVKIPLWVKLGNNVTIHEGCIIGADGLGHEQLPDKTWVAVPHVGGVMIEDNVEILPLTTVGRGTVQDTLIGGGTKIDMHVHIAHNCKIGRNCIIAAGVMFGGSCIVGDNVWIGHGSTIQDHVTIANNVFIGSGTNVIKSILDEGVVVVGNPGRIIKKRVGY